MADDTLPQTAADCAEARRTAEAARDDAALLQLRRLERAHQGLPPVLDGARRQRLLWTDAVSTTWLAWEVESGCPLLLRCLRPSWREDTVMQRRLARAVQDTPAPLGRPAWRSHGDWPHLRLALPGPVLSEIPRPRSLRPLAVLAHALRGLDALHQAGLCLGHDARLADHLALTEDGAVALVWLDRFDAQGTPADDLRALAALVATLDGPPEEAFVHDLMADWQSTPPPSATDALWLLQHAMAAALLAARQGLLQVQHQQRVRLRRQRLLLWSRRLAHAVPPPQARACLWAPAPPQAPTLALSDGQSVSGGASTTPDALPRLASADAPTDMDVAACRALLRAPARREPALEPLRQQIQAELGGGPRDDALLLRWLRARLQLRSLLLLMDRRPAPYSRSTESR